MGSQTQSVKTLAVKVLSGFTTIPQGRESMIKNDCICTLIQPLVMPLKLSWILSHCSRHHCALVVFVFEFCMCMSTCVALLVPLLNASNPVAIRFNVATALNHFGQYVHFVLKNYAPVCPVSASLFLLCVFPTRS